MPKAPRFCAAPLGLGTVRRASAAQLRGRASRRGFRGVSSDSTETQVWLARAKRNSAIAQCSTQLASTWLRNTRRGVTDLAPLGDSVVLSFEIRRTFSNH